MKNRNVKFAVVGVAVVAAGFARLSQPSVVAAPNSQSAAKSTGVKKEKIVKVVRTEAQWKKLLTAAQFDVLRQEGTERAFTGDYHPRKETGVYNCAACGLSLYRSETQFDSGTGWPSFWKPIAGHVQETTDADGSRTEVKCARCDGHLGHVFTDGPKPTGLRYCMNAVAMKFVADKKTPAKK